MTLADYKPKARVGDTIRTNGDHFATNNWKQGVVIDVTDTFFDFQPEGTVAGRWRVRWENPAARLTRLEKGTKPMTTLKEAFKSMVLAEPFRTFRKAGVTNGDNELTSEGKDIFLGYLLEKYGTDFKKDVVDKIVAEQKESKKSC